MEELKIEILPGADPSIRILKLSGPFTLRTIFEFQEVVRSNQTATTIIDLTGVPYMDSAALGAILGFHASCHREGRNYTLVGVSERIQTLFKVAGVDGLLRLHTAAAEAAEA